MKAMTTKAGAAALLMACAGAHAELTVVAVTGQTAPGSTLAWSGFAEPSINSSGVVAFRGFFDAPFGANAGIWRGEPGSLEAVMFLDDDLPGDPPCSLGTYEFFGSATSQTLINEAGVVAFAANTRGQAFLNSVWLSDGPTPEQVAHECEAAPGTGALFSGFSAVTIGAGRTVAFRATTGISTPSAAYIGTPAGVTPVIIEGQDAPGTTGQFSDMRFPFSTPEAFAFNAAGEFSLLNDIVGTGIDSTNNVGIWTNACGGVMLLARTGDAAPGTSGTFNSFDVPWLMDTGDSVFRGFLEGPGIDSTNNSGVWVGQPGSVTPVVLEGAPAPGTSGVFGSIDRVLASSTGPIAVQARLLEAAGTGEGFWVGSLGSLELVARRGDLAPGADAPFGGFSFSLIDVNSIGPVVFGASLLREGDVTDANDFGLWAGAPGAVRLVVREGDLIDVDPGPGKDLRTVRLAFVTGSSRANFGNPVALNDSGLLALLLEFDDGSEAICTFDLSAPAGTQPCTADFNNDGMVDGADFGTFGAQFGRTDCPD